MKKFVVALVSKGGRQNNYFIIAETKAQAAVQALMEETKALSVSKDKEHLKEEAIKNYEVVIPLLNEKEVAGEFESEDDALNFVNDVVSEKIAVLAIVVKMLDEINWTVCLPISSTELN